MYGATCLNQNNVNNWAKLFKEVRSSVEDRDRPGQPREVKSPEMIKSVIQTDRRRAVDDIARILRLCVGMAHKIVHNERMLTAVG